MPIAALVANQLFCMHGGRSNLKIFRTEQSLALFSASSYLLTIFDAEVPEENRGYQINFDDSGGGGAVITVFSAPAYQKQKNDGAVMFVDKHLEISFKILKPLKHR
uniref:protein-serine/threonine phosphatase n=1 Tax=Romanomermis culicivorax TaxID=13658 RepID=A0A915I3F0_ROMCU